MKHLLHFLLAFFFFFFFLLISPYFVVKTDGLGSTTDRAALLSFKTAVSDPKNFLQSWTLNTSHCNWHGITCSTKGARVRSLTLSGLSLFGPIPPHLSNLTSLFLLDLSNNSFYGQIPSQFGNLSHLQYLYLHTNSINGTIPFLLSQCRNLKEIELFSNQLTGNIPYQLGFLQRLEVLKFSINGLTGAIPATFGNMSSLMDLSVARNQLVGEIPSELGRLRNLHSIQLSENQLNGDIPNSIFNISSLAYLSLTNNTLTGKLPSGIGYVLPNLVELYLATNLLEGMIPMFLSNASLIRFLDLTGNGFHGPIPLFGAMKDLVEINLGKNLLSSTTMLNFQLIESLRNCTQLKVIRIYSNRLAGQFPSSVANLSTHLQHFCFADNFLTGTFPEGLDKFQDLISLSIEQNSFTGEIPEAVGRLKNLQSFSAFDNMFVGEIPDIFGNFTQLSYLRIGKNQFSGRIPVSIEACQLLNTLGLAANRLSGSIPKEIYSISTLVSLNLQQNALSGALPEEIGNLKQIEDMDVSWNQLSGNIPSIISSCSSFQNLNMAGNNFTGSIPSTIGKLASLETLDLSSNSLVGVIPEELGKLKYLIKLNLSFNRLEGKVPMTGVFLSLTRDNLKGNDNLCHRNQTIAEKLGLPKCSAEGRNRHILMKVILPVAIFSCLMIVFCCFTRTFISWKKQKAKRDKGMCLSCPLKGLPPMISYSDICLATYNFSAENLIGNGGFGSVYKGRFRNLEDRSHTEEIILAVKVLDLEQSKAAKSFEAECETLRNVRHRNLVKVITSCSSVEHKGQEFKALIMEFMSNGNLDQWLYQGDQESGLCLTLRQRLNIAIDVASAMDYLHHDCDPPVVHCDLKPGNVLLNDDMVAHVGDFGLARFLSQENGSSISTIGLKGSIGYIAPEYGLGGKVSTFGDVYSFGILLLEVFIAKKPTDEMFKEGLSLKSFAKAVNENRVIEIVDPKLFMNNGSNSLQSTTASYSSDGHSNTNYLVEKDEELVAAAIRVGLSCAAQSPKDRITMREALTMLQKIKSKT